MHKKLMYLMSLVLLLGLTSSVFGAYLGQLGIGISLPERCETFVDQVHEH